MRHLLRASIIIVAIIPLLASCSWLKETAKETAAQLIDCTTDAAKMEIAAFGPLVEHVVISATNDSGGVDFDPVRALASRMKTSAQRCVVASVITALAKVRVRDPNAPASESLQPDPSALRGGFDKLRVELYGGARFKTVDGDL